MAANLKEVRERIRSVHNTQQITKAMKMVSAAKLRRAQQAILQLRPFSNKLNQILRNILLDLEGEASTPFDQERPAERVCIVVVTSNRGLAGAFNSNIIKAALQLIETRYADVLAKGNLTMLFIGKKGYDFFRSRYRNITFITDYINLFEDLSDTNVARVSSRMMEAFLNGEYDRVDVAYSLFKNAATQFPVTEQFLPVAKLEPVAGEDQQQRTFYIFEPSKEGLLEYLLPRILQAQFHRYILDTHASEHGARMTSMDKATENAQEILQELRISYNKARQEAITKEILEIVGGAAALSGR